MTLVITYEGLDAALNSFHSTVRTSVGVVTLNAASIQLRLAAEAEYAIIMAFAQWCIVAVLVTQSFNFGTGAKILGIFPFQARSHSFVATALLKELAARGHELTVITPNPQTEKIPNYTDIVLKTTMADAMSKEAGAQFNLFERNTGAVMKAAFMWTMNKVTCDLMLQEEAIQKLIHAKDIHFDLIIMEAFFNECFLGFVHKFKAPLIQLCTFGGTHWIGDFVGNPNPYAYVPDPFLEYSDKMNFWERTINTLLGTAWRLGRQFYYLPGQDAIMRKYFNDSDDLPSASEIECSTSLVLLNHHFSIGHPRPLMPNMVQVGGMHVKPPKPLPQDIQKYLDEAPEGVIYFSMGSNLQSSQLPVEKRDAFLKVFSELKQRVLWKWETDTLPGQPKNVKLSKWFPQSDILAHKNVRLFMTHGGLLSTQEALNRAVPLVGIPVFGDQKLNMAGAISAGYGVMLSFHNVTTDSLRWALKEVLENTRYRENAERLSQIYRDQPSTPIEQAVFWTEYVIRHKGARHMRSAVMDLAWYQYFLLDVIAVILLAVSALLFTAFVVFRTVIRKICGGKKVDKSSKKRDVSRRWLTLTLLLPIWLSECEGARILGLFPVPGKSHMAVNSALVRELAHRGHQVTVLSPFPEEKPIPNFTDITVKKLELRDILNETNSTPNPFEMQGRFYVQNIIMLWGFGSILCDKILQDPAVQKLMHSKDENFDLILVESFFMDCFLGFAHKYKVPVVQICAFGGTEVLGDLVGNPNPYSYVPDVFREYSDKMSFNERFLNTLGLIFQKLGRRFYFIPKQDEIMRRHFNTENIPSIRELEKSTVLILLNHHFSISYPRPLMPNMIEVGGMHVKPPKKLPDDINKYITEAPDGVILFSMGSNLKSSDMPASKIEAFVQAFASVKQRVLWKWETETVPGLSKNVKLSKWLPQTDILAHPNVRLFITHGGLLSTQETIYRGVPVVGIPIFGDQRLNMARAVTAGFGVQLNYNNITAGTVIEAINEVLVNPSYRQNVQRLSRIYRDQPLTPLEQAVFWTEYVIRHKGAPHMRSAALDLTWYQYFLLDVIAVLLLAVGSVLMVVFLILRAVFRKVFGSKATEKSKKKRD